MSNLRVLVLPEGVKAETLLRLPHPRTGRPALYVPCETTDATLNDGSNGLLTPAPSPSTSHHPAECLLEVQAVAPPVDARRSWFIDQTVAADGRMMLCTPFDPLFLLIPLLQAVHATNTRFLPYRDIFETAADAHIFQSGSDAGEITAAGEDAIRLGDLNGVKYLLESICDVEAIAEDLLTYRFSLSKTIEALSAKIERLAAPASFQGPSSALRRSLARYGVGDGQGLSEEVAAQARSKAALDTLSHYLPDGITDALRAVYSFEALDAYLAQQAPAMPTPDADDWIDPDPRKLDVGKPKGGGAALAKRKATKVPANRNAERLKKVDTRSMHKLTTFFGKKT